MIIRIVQMTFREDEVGAFQELFDERKEKIRHFTGCLHLELWQDANNPKIFCTYSHWENEEQLNHYRFSALFKDTWAKTRALFEAPPQAWSLERKVEVK